MVRAVPVPKTAPVPLVTVISVEVRLPLLMASVVPPPLTAAPPPVTIISFEVRLPNISVLCLLLKVFQSVLLRYPDWLVVACFTWMEVPVPRTAFAPPVMVNTEDVASARFPFLTVNVAPLPKTALLPPVMVRSAEVRLPLVMVRFSPMPITALVPPVMAMSVDETLPKTRAFCLP